MYKRTIIGLGIFIVICIGILINKDTKLSFVSNIDNTLISDSNKSNIFYLSLHDVNITTNNISEYFSNMDIISIIPYMNSLYKNKVGELKYNFTNSDLESNIERFISYYKKKLRDQGFVNELELIQFNGIKIEEICLYAKNGDIYKLLKGNSRIKYRYRMDEQYRTL